MATLTASVAFDYRLTNLNTLVSYKDTFNFYENINGTELDIAEFEAYQSETGFTYTQIYGINLTYNESYTYITGGTATEIYHFSWNGIGYSDIYLLEGFSYSAFELSKAINTASTSDDYAILTSIYSGADTFNLSSQNDIARGYSGNDILYGNSGNDSLFGDSGNDNLQGGSGNDQIIGGAGFDKLNGGTGADTIIVNAAVGTSSDSSHVVASGINNDRGQDTLNSFSLTEDKIKVVATNVTNFVHGTDTTIGAGAGSETTGSASSFSQATGLIELNQTNNNNWTDLGDIALTFSTPSTTLTEANFEARLQYKLTGNSANNTLAGGNHADILAGGAGNDTLYGRAGSDTLTGGLGADSFVFNTALGSSNIDKITDFSTTDDTIKLENSIFTKFGTATTGVINIANFASNTTGLAADSNDYIIYDKDTGKLFYDADGSGAGASVQITTLGVNLSLTHADFFLV